MNAGLKLCRLFRSNFMRGRVLGRRTMSLAYTDILKLCVLVVLFAICFHSGIVKFAPDVLQSYTAAVELPTVNRDFSVCNKVSTCDACQDKDKLRDKCTEDLNAGYDSADDKCSGYLKKLGECRSAQRRCTNEQNNLAGCSSMVMKDLFAKWNSPETVTV